MDFFSHCVMLSSGISSLHVVQHSHCKKPHLPVSIEVNEGRLWEQHQVYIYCWLLQRQSQWCCFSCEGWWKKRSRWITATHKKLWVQRKLTCLSCQSPVHWEALPCWFFSEKTSSIFHPYFYCWLGTSLNCETLLYVKSNDLIPTYSLLLAFLWCLIKYTRERLFNFHET